MKIPYTNHRKTPIVKTAYIPNDKSFVCFDLIVFIACGKNEMVVQLNQVDLPGFDDQSIRLVIVENGLST